MPEANGQKSRRALWIGAGIVLIAVFFTARYLLRERLPVRVATVEHVQLVNTVSTNGRVEPVMNYQHYFPIRRRPLLRIHSCSFTSSDLQAAHLALVVAVFADA